MDIATLLNGQENGIEAEPERTSINTVDYKQLVNAANSARLVLRRYREERREAVREYIGAHYSEEGARHLVPVNMLGMYVKIVLRNLVAKNPRVLLSTFNYQAKPSVSVMNDWLNEELSENDFAGSLQRIALDALFSVGIAKVALASPSDSAVGGWEMEAGEPFMERIDLDDFVFDVHARDFNQVSFIGHRYRAPRDIVRSNQSYSEARNKVEWSGDSPYNVEGDERINILGRTYLSNQIEFEQFVDLWEFYLPRHKLVVTMGGAGGNPDANQVLEVKQWLGPYCGPYHILGFGVIPGNAMPKGPIMDLVDLHRALNGCYRKLNRQAERMKEVLPVMGGASEDAGRLQQANDGEQFRCDNPEPKPVVYGGPQSLLQQYALHLKDLFSWLAGNLDIAGGLSAQSPTATQDTMLNQNSSATITEMQQSVVKFTENVTRALSWYWWNHPTKEMQSQYSPPGMPEISVNRNLPPQDRQQIPFDQLRLRVDPYSMQYQSPQQRLQAMRQMVQQIALPMMPIMQQQGIGFDLAAYLELEGKYQDNPDIKDILVSQEPTPDMQQQPSGPDLMEIPGQETRHVRENRPTKTSAGQSQVMQQILAGGNPQPKETNSIMPGGMM